MAELQCPHCGKAIALAESEESISLLEAEIARIRAALRAKNADSSGSIWDRKPSSSYSDWGFTRPSSKTDNEAVNPRSAAQAVDPAADRTRAALADWGFVKKKAPETTSSSSFFGAEPTKKEEPQEVVEPLKRVPSSTATSLKAVGGPAASAAVPVKASTNPASRTAARTQPPSTPRPAPPHKRTTKPTATVLARPTSQKPAAKKHTPAVQKTPAVVAKKAAPEANREIKPSALLGGLAASKLNAGQVATVKMIYDRFAPGAALAEVEVGKKLSEYLDADANLNAGQRETLRTVVARFDK
jgi:hypothetical protein